MASRKIVLSTLVMVGIAAASSPAEAIFLDGSGHYSLRAETQANPGFRSDTGTYQAIQQFFSLTGEARLNDRSSFFLEFSLFGDPSSSFLGDTPEPAECPVRRTLVGKDASGADVYSESRDCAGRFQNTGEPGYSGLVPRVTKAYARYAFDYCLLEAGRRPRDWGTGIFLDSGKGIFSEASSTFDGFDCNVNITAVQSLGFRFGFDKLAETGTFRDNPYDRKAPDRAAENDFDNRGQGFGATSNSDDIDQLFMAIEWDDRKANAGAAFTKHIGIYFANVLNKESSTDIKFLDLYTGFFLANLTFRNEILFRLGKSGDPNWSRLGGALFDGEEPATNKVQSVGLAGQLEYTFSRSGAVIGPQEYNQGNATRHVGFFEYAYAPGSDQGYTDVEADPTTGAKVRSKEASAMAFHKNYQPALIFFNARTGTEDQAIDGIYDPSRFMNATLLALGYRFESIETGNIEAKLITAQLNEVASAEVKAPFVALPEGTSNERFVGYHGKSLGYELDVTWSRKIGRELELGLAGAFALPSDALKTKEKGDPSTTWLLQGFTAFKF